MTYKSICHPEHSEGSRVAGKINCVGVPTMILHCVQDDKRGGKDPIWEPVILSIAKDPALLVSATVLVCPP